MTGFIPAHRLGFVLRNKPPLLKIWTQVVTSCLYLWYIILYTDTILYTLICISITLQRILLNQRAHQATKLTPTSYKNVICYQDRISSAIHLVLVLLNYANLSIFKLAVVTIGYRLLLHKPSLLWCTMRNICTVFERSSTAAWFVCFTAEKFPFDVIADCWQWEVGKEREDIA